MLFTKLYLAKESQVINVGMPDRYCFNDEMDIRYSDSDMSENCRQGHDPTFVILYHGCFELEI